MMKAEVMRIGIDGLPLTEVLTGIGHYTNELARHLALEVGDQIEVIAPRNFLADLNSDRIPPDNLRLVRSRVNPLSRRWWSIGLPRYIRNHSLEVFHGTNFEVPLQKVCPTVLTIHDLSMFLHSDTQERHLVRRAHGRLPLMAASATMIITPTESVRREVHEHFHVPLDTIVAVPEAARNCFRPLEASQTIATRKRLGLHHEFLLFVGTVEPRKNLATLLSAFEAVSQVREQPLQLVFAGRKGWLVDDLYNSLKRSPVGGRIVLTGYLSDEDLCALYSSCAAFIYPSVYEGFGLPPLEAMACGAPVIASRIPSIIEVTGGAARLFAPEDANELGAAILELLSSEGSRQTLAVAGIQQAARFSWCVAAVRSRSVYAEAMARYRHR
jgi:glycosyltransferase involved in cell wall biosynthesis